MCVCRLGLWPCLDLAGLRREPNGDVIVDLFVECHQLAAPSIRHVDSATVYVGNAEKLER